ncbi:MAG: hypothetical protein KF841_15550 [Phycisphaerae bacterium]|nr:hypothetical protein [Phycisphaerae bacterium]
MNLMDELLGGAIGHYGLAGSFETLKELVQRIHVWGDEKDASISNGDFSGEYGGDIYADLCIGRCFVDAACSQTVVAAICPFIESLFTRAFAIMRPAWQAGSAIKSHLRWTKQLKPGDEYKRWSPSWVFNVKSYPRQGFIEGTQQLLEALGFGSAIPTDSPEFNLVSALFLYRNKSLHHGYEWPTDPLNAFKLNMDAASRKDSRWQQWFDISTIGADLWMITITKQLVVDSLGAMQSIATSLREIENEILLLSK